MHKPLMVPIESIITERTLEHGDDLTDLTNNIFSGKLKRPILVDENMKLLDGLRRLTALKSLGAEKVQVALSTSLEDTCEEIAKTVKHGVLALPPSPHRTWALFQDTKEQQKDRGVRMRKRRVGIPRGTVLEPVPRTRTMMNEALGLGPGESYLASVTYLYSHFLNNTDPGLALGLADIRARLEHRQLSVYEARGAVDRLRASGLTGDIVSVAAQRDALATALSQLSGMNKGVTRIGELNPEINQAELLAYIKSFEQGKRALHAFINTLKKRISTE